MSNYSIGITPDLTTYSNTTKNLIDKWYKIVDHIFEDWQVIKDDYGEVVDALPEWHIRFKDGSERTIELTNGKASPPTMGLYDCKTASQRDTQAIINKHLSHIKSVEKDFLIAQNNFGEKCAILPRRRFVFKTADDIIENLKYIPVDKNQGGNNGNS